MSSMEHPGSGHSGWAHSIEPEWAFLVMVAAFAIGVAMSLPW